MAFRWSHFSKRIARDFARAAGLRVARAADELAEKYGEPPTAALVADLWPLLRDRWLAARPGIRTLVVLELRKAGLGDGSIDIGSPAGQADYLRSCRRSTRLTEIVLAVFIDEVNLRIPQRDITVLEAIADNVAYIRGELPGLSMPDGIRTAILAACARFDPVVKKVSQSEALYELGSNADGLMSAFEALHAVVLRLREAARLDSRLAIVVVLLEESASNMLSAYQAYGDAMATGGGE